MSDNEKLQEEALRWIRDNSQKVISFFAEDEKFIADTQALSVFMAGSPGAGKTEISKALVKELGTSILIKDVIRIDPDEIRDMLPQYVGGNAHLFQQAISIGADKIFNHALKTNKHILLDGTFSNYDRARQNISKSLKKHRAVFILYVYTDPILAWKLTQAREKKEGRNIPKDAFIKEFFGAMETVQRIKQEYKTRVNLNILVHDYENMQDDYFDNVNSIDKHVKIGYTSKELEGIL